MAHNGQFRHNEIHELRDELDHAVGNADKLISDLNIIGNIVGAVSAVTNSIELAQSRMSHTLGQMRTIEKVSFVLSKLPVVGPFGSAILFVMNRVEDPLDKSVGMLDQLETPLSQFNEAVGYIALGIGTVNVSAAGVRKLMQDKADWLTMMEEEGLVHDTNLLHDSDQDWYDFLDQANHDSDVALAASQPLREELAALDFSVYREIYEFFSSITETFDAIDRVVSPIAPALDAVEEALEPVQWAFDAAEDVLNSVVQPVVDAIMEATGLNDLIDELVSKLNPAADLLNEMTRNLERLKVDLEIPGLAGDVSDFYDQLEASLFPGGVAFPEIRDLGILVMEQDDGSVNVAGTDGDDHLVGTAGDDNFAGFGGDDTIDGGGGTDRLLFLHKIEDYRLSLTGDPGDGQTLQVQVSWRDPAIADEGVDTANEVELFHFTNPALGDVHWSSVRQFIYTESGSRNVTGTAADDWIFGDARVNELGGGDGDDRLFGGSGNDLLNGGAGDDIVYAGDGNDTIAIGEGVDQV
ncbi:MAG: hypothetical protein D6801_06560, partial [Alphaproteobacteria bacterium]